MALTIQKEPTDPAFSKNLVAFQVDTDTDPLKDVYCRVWIEDTPYSDTWTLVTELKATPNSDGECFFYLEGLMEEDLLNYDKPDVIQTSGVAANVARRVKCDFYEFDLDDWELLEELYHEDSDATTNSNVTFNALSTSASEDDYVLVLETEENGITDPIFSDGTNTEQPSVNIDLGDQRWYDITSISYFYDRVSIPGYTKGYLYRGVVPTLENGSAFTVLLGGYFETDLDNATFERSPDGIIVETPDGIGVRWLW